MSLPFVLFVAIGNFASYCPYALVVLFLEPSPPGPLFQSPRPTSIRLRWTAPAGNYDGFRLSYEQNGVLIERDLPSTSLQYEVRFLYPDTLYRMELVSLSGGVVSSPSSGAFRTGKVCRKPHYLRCSLLETSVKV